MVGWHHWLDGHEYEQALGVGDGQGSLACCSSWGHKESDMTEQLNWLNWTLDPKIYVVFRKPIWRLQVFQCSCHLRNPFDSNIWAANYIPKDFHLTIHPSEVAQSCPTLCNPMDCSPPGSSVHGILQARILEWVAISFSRRSSWPRDRTQVSHIAGRRFNLWATREAPIGLTMLLLLLLSRFSHVRLCATP